MSRKVNCYDNAHMKSFWATLKTEALVGQIPGEPRQSPCRWREAIPGAAPEMA
jgi:transposase InsO family protein